MIRQSSYYSNFGCLLNKVNMDKINFTEIKLQEFIVLDIYWSQHVVVQVLAVI